MQRKKTINYDYLPSSRLRQGRRAPAFVPTSAELRQGKRVRRIIQNCAGFILKNNKCKKGESDPKSLTPKARFQTFNLIPVMTALENITLPMIFAGMSLDEANEKGKDLLEKVGLGARLNHRPFELSGDSNKKLPLPAPLPMILPSSSRMNPRAILTSKQDTRS
jgi:hypothetical protein